MNAATTSKIQKYVDAQDRELTFSEYGARYYVTTVPGEGQNYTYAIYAWYGSGNETYRDNLYFDKVEDLAWAMKEISGDMRKWHVGSRWIKEHNRTGI